MIRAAPAIRVEAETVYLSGEWTLEVMLPDVTGLRLALKKAAIHDHWDLRGVTRLDSAGAALLWGHWGRRWPATLNLSEPIRPILERAAVVAEMPLAPAARPPTFLELIGERALRLGGNLQALLALYGQLVLDLLHVCRHPADMPWKEFSANLYKSGAQALPVAALVGFLIGVTISYLSALQLKSFGADQFIINILGIAIIRELGPVVVAVLVAGRSGSAMTAQIGVMRVTEEIDALSVMGISHTRRIVFPKVCALACAMPLLVLWTSAVALVGGMLAAFVQLDISLAYFINQLPRAVPLANLLIGLGKGVVFGFTIALVACHFGLRVRPNTESLSANTTTAVVVAITAVIIIDAIFAVLTRRIGLPQL